MGKIISAVLILFAAALAFSAPAEAREYSAANPPKPGERARAVLRALAADLRSGEVMVGSKAGRSSLAGARWSGVVQIGRAARGEGEPSVFRLASGLYLSLFVGKRTRTGRLRRILLPLSAAGNTLEVRWMKAHSGLRTPRTTNF